VIDIRRRRLLQAAALAAAGGALAPWPQAAWPAPAPRRSRLILLGTAGGPTPKPDRSAPAQAIVVDDAIYVVDCGDGVARQLVRAGLSLQRIRDVFITHQHSDHNADYGNLLWLAWAAGLTTPVDAFGPPPLERMTRLFLEMNAYDIETRIHDEGRPPLGPLIRTHEITEPGKVMQDERVKVTSALVQHPPVKPAFAYRFDCPDRSIVISGDTRPSDQLVALAHGADVLVHEALYLPAIERLVAGDNGSGKLRRHLLAAHTTTEELGKIAARAGVKTLVLSHLVPGGSPPIADDAWIEGVRAHFDGRIVVGHDLMEL
jgi:ribonuclease BN (tRNA processing enzyme)